MKTADFLSLSRRELRGLLASGHAIDPKALDESEYRGVSLGLPRPIVALTWLTFRKTFHRDPRTGRLRGWNVRMEQTGLEGLRTPMRSGGAPRCFGHYEVKPNERGLLIDYGRWARARDPIVALEAGSVERLLGWTYLDLGLARVCTPSFFLLEREGPLTFVPA